MATKMAHRYTEEHGKQEVTLPEEFKCHMALFSDEEAKAFPVKDGVCDITHSKNPKPKSFQSCP